MKKMLTYGVYAWTALALIYWAWLMLLLLLSFAPWTKPGIWLLMLAFPFLLLMALWRRSVALVVVALVEFALAVAVFQTLN